MVIHASDRLADVLARDERMVEIIAAASPRLSGLRDPSTRRVMARLATIGQIARMAGMEPEILVRRVNLAIATEHPAMEGTPGGAAGEVPRARHDPSGHGQATLSTSSDMSPHLSALPPDLIVDLDVRDDLRNGREPFSRIMAARGALPPGGVLRLRATFEPLPLYTVMEKQGYDHSTERLADDDWRVWFYPRRRGGATDAPEAPPTPSRDGDAPAAAGATGPGEAVGDIIVLDVRALEPPEPMVHTLATLETLPPGMTLLQINERVPQFLLPKLEELGFAYRVQEQEPEGVVRVFIRRRPEA